MGSGKRFLSYRFTFLLGFILLLFLLNILLPISQARSILFDGLVLVVLVAGARACRIRGYFTTSSVFVVLLVVLTVGKYLSPGPLVLGVRSACMAFLLIYLAARVFKEVLMDREVSTDTIMGSICAYLLIGVCWSFFYGLVAIMQPGSFAISEPLTAQALASPQERLSILLYFSFVTLTTLGFGDITPLTSAARSLCWMEAVVGQLFLTIMVARLVGLHIMSSSMNRDG
ncbi:MAG: potassium channel family protein [Acidobacteria bacterium]|nr:potassium channel family protein [Acidobacteriota bacterium]